MEKNNSKLERIYPKILIIGRYFVKGPGDLTLTNLFKGWDKDSLAVAALNINNPDFEICGNYYQLGSLEDKRNFPYNIIEYNRRGISGVVHEQEQKKNFKLNRDKNIKIKNLYHYFSNFFGLSHYRKRFRYSADFLKWVRDFSPDYIYSQLPTFENILFVSKLHKDLKIPVAIHIMDDWPSTTVKRGILKFYWKKVIDSEFRKLLSNAKVLMSISEAMSIEYKKRYGYNFIPFHNPVEIDFWEVPAYKLKYTHNQFVILYAGRIGPGIQNCFLDMTVAIKNLIDEGFKIELHIQVVNYSPILDNLSKFNFVKLNSAIPYSELPALLAKADLLLIPNDFDDQSISYLKFSMPTKASEYMVSGTPILVYSSIKNAITKHALKYEWAFVVSEKNFKKLEDGIREAYENKDLRIKLGSSAKEFAKKHFDSNIVRNEFRKAFT